MTDHKIIELTPFRANLTRALALRGERLLASTDLATEVAALEPLEAYFVVKEIGLDQSLPILLQLSPEQLMGCVDLDCWRRYDFAADSLDEWLTALAHDGAETLARAFYSLDYVVQLLFLTQTITVYDPDTDQIPEEVEGQESTRVVTPDGFFLLELNGEVALKTHPYSVLDALYQLDPSAAHQLLRQVRVDLATQIEEEALRFRNGRLQDIGFVAPEEAAVLFSRPSAFPPKFRPSMPLEDEAIRIPAVYAGVLSESSLLEQALSLITDKEILTRLEQEVVWTINAAIIAYGEKTEDVKQIADIAERVRDTISLGLESIMAQQEPDSPLVGTSAAVKASSLVTVWGINDLFRHGFAATLDLRQELRQAMHEPQFQSWYELVAMDQTDEPGDRLERAFVAGLNGRHCLHGGIDPANLGRVKAFTGLEEIKDARLRLKRLVERISPRV